MARTKVFICYSREDDRWRQALRVHLKPFADDDGPLDVWDDTGIEAGELWREQIAGALATAKVGVLLVSPDFLASEFISDDEIPALLAAAATAGARLLCVYARPSLAHLRQYKYTDPVTGERRTRRLTEFQGLNSPEAPLSSLTEHECGVMLTRVAGAILAAAEGSGARPRPTADPRPYLEKLRHETRWIDVRGIGAKAAERVELERVYTRLRVVGPVGAGTDDAGDKRHAHALAGDLRTGDLELRDLLREHPNLVLVGDPGAGKTTFLRFVALNLARALLGEEKDACLERIGLGEIPLSLAHRGEGGVRGRRREEGSAVRRRRSRCSCAWAASGSS